MASIPPQLVGESPEFHALLDWVSDIASLNVPVLVLGETGVGKEMVASRLHFLSQRWEQGYYSINCAAYDPDVVDTLLYGDGRDGLLVQAEGGTLFIDNIETLPFHQLERIAQVIEYSEFDPIDGSSPQAIDIRFVLSTNPEFIARMTARAEFAQLLSRISGDLVHVERLRDRKADIAPLMLHFGRKMVSKLGAEQFPGVTPEALEALMAYDWPGNVRELKNVVERSTARAFLSDSTLSAPIANMVFSPFTRAFRKITPQETTQSYSELAISAEFTEETIVQTSLSTHLTERVMIFERGLIDEAMQVSDHHQGKAAEHLGLSYHQFRGMLRKHGLRK